MNFTLIEVMGFAAFLSNVVGNILLARLNIWGWPVRIFSIVLWGFYAVNLESPSLLANACTFFCINCYGWGNWYRKRTVKEGTS
jgi:hypothetical protein